jgi:hypothetical protein
VADFSAEYFASGDLYGAIPSPATATYFAPSIVNVVTSAANIRYFQRVLDSGAGGTGLWCYYNTLNAVNAAPVSGATSPNWTGATPPTSPQVVAAVPVP